MLVHPVELWRIRYMKYSELLEGVHTAYQPQVRALLFQDVVKLSSSAKDRSGIILPS